MFLGPDWRGECLNQVGALGFYVVADPAFPVLRESRCISPGLEIQGERHHRTHGADHTASQYLGLRCSLAPRKVARATHPGLDQLVDRGLLAGCCDVCHDPALWRCPVRILAPLVEEGDCKGPPCSTSRRAAPDLDSRPRFRHIQPSYKWRCVISQDRWPH